MYPLETGSFHISSTESSVSTVEPTPVLINTKLSWWSSYPAIILVLLRIGKVELRWWKALWWPFMIQGKRPGHLPQLLGLTQQFVLLHWDLWERSQNFSPLPGHPLSHKMLGLPGPQSAFGAAGRAVCCCSVLSDEHCAQPPSRDTPTCAALNAPLMNPKGSP